MSSWKNGLSCLKEAACAVFLGFFAILSLMYPHSLDGEKFNRKGGMITTLWGWPLGLICGALAIYSVSKIFRLLSGSKLQS